MSGRKSRLVTGRRESSATSGSGNGRRPTYCASVESVESRVLLAMFAVPSQYSTIGAAVAAANAAPDPSNQVVVSPGTYDESNILITSPLTLISTGGSANTIIDGGQASTPQDGIIEVTGNSGLVTIGKPGQGFTLQNPPTNEYDGDINSISITNINGPVTVQDNILTGLDGVNNPFDTGLLAESTPANCPVTVQSNTFQEMWQGVFLQQTVGSGSVSNNVFQNLVPSTDTTVSPAHVYEPEGIFALTLGGPTYNVSGLSIVGNNFSSFNGLAITVDGGYEGYAPAQFSNVQINSNTITSIGFTADTYRAGITLIDDPGTSGTDGSAGGVVNSTIDDNTLMAQTSCATGSVGVWLLGPNNNLTIDNNNIDNLDRGILIDQQVPGEAYASGLVVNQNSIAGNNIGIDNPSSNLVNASYNYWGVTDATSVKAQANGGVNVDYNPWLGDGTNNSAGPGFQPNLTPAITDAAQISGSDSVRSGQPYTLTLSQVASDSHIGTITSFTVNWGDGTSSSPDVETVSPGTAQHTYNVGSQTSYTISATATSTLGTFQVANTVGVTVTTVSTLVVTTLTPTASGFHVRFSDAINTSTLELYAAPSAPNPPPPDVTLMGPSNTPVRGSLKLDSDGQGFTFVATGPPLASGTYTATLLGTSGGIQEANTGDPLDGTGSGNATGSNYAMNFTIATNSGATVSIPDFARAPGQPIVIPNATGTGLPVRISDGTGVTSVMLVITYDPTLLTIDPTNIKLGPGVPTTSQIVYNATIPGRLAICITSPTALSSGPQDLLELSASVPTSAPYLSKSVINVQVLDINGSTSMGTGDQAVDIVDYLGNVTGTGRYSSADALQIQQYVISSISNPGFTKFPLVDPRILADVYGNGHIATNDALLIQQAVISPTFPSQLPAYVGLPSSTATGPDPELSIPRDLAGMPGGDVVVPVQFRQTNATPIELQSFNLVLSYDPGSFSVASIQPGDLASGFRLTESIDQADGLIIVSGTSSQPLMLAPGAIGNLILVDFKVLTSAKSGSLVINLLDNSGTSVTSLNGGGLTLVPAPTNAGNDPNDGVIAVGGRRTQSPFPPGRGPATPISSSKRSRSQGQTVREPADRASTPVAWPASPGTQVLGVKSPAGIASATITPGPGTPLAGPLQDLAIESLSTEASGNSVTPSAGPLQDLAIESLSTEAPGNSDVREGTANVAVATANVDGPGQVLSLIPWTGSTSDDSQEAADFSGSDSISPSVTSFAARRVAFRH